jgi:response regulator RpfG family c-di-GMP phosphodiesterase
MIPKKPRVLCVDDEERVVQGLKLTLGRRFDVTLATSGAAALGIIAREDQDPFAVVISDMRMPAMNGAQLLAEVRATSPDSTRLLLTGQADIESAIAAINQGQIFRFLTKPCPPEQLVSAVEAGVAQHRLVTAERELLDHTLRGAINMLTDVLAMVSPTVFGRATRLKECVKLIAGHLKIEGLWAIEIAAMLSQVPAITLPASTIDKLYDHRPLSPDERHMVERMPEVLEQLLANIPRLEPVREILRAADRPFDPASSEAHPIGARILKVAIDFDDLDSQGMENLLALETMRGRTGVYDPRVLEMLCELSGGARRTAEVKELRIADLRPGMVLAAPVQTKVGQLICARGAEVTAGLLQRLRNFSKNAAGVREPVRVIVKHIDRTEGAA